MPSQFLFQHEAAKWVVPCRNPVSNASRLQNSCSENVFFSKLFSLVLWQRIREDCDSEIAAYGV